MTDFIIAHQKKNGATEDRRFEAVARQLLRKLEMIISILKAPSMSYY